MKILIHVFFFAFQRDGEAHDSSYPLHPPLPGYASISKLDIYIDPSVFRELDQQAINVAQADQRTFTDLVRQLTHNCETDVEKARQVTMPPLILIILKRKKYIYIYIFRI